MFAARANQENAVHEQQTAKSLTAGGKGLLAPKTPFGKARNNENAAQAQAKTAGGKAGRADVFVTPANPRNRAPLGNKTTNAKAFQTPAPLLAPDKPKESERPSSTRPSSPRLRRSKIKVHDASTAPDAHALAQDPEEREIEHMPSREVPLPEDFEDIWPRNRDYSALKGNNLTRGWYAGFAPHEEDDDSELSDFDEKCRQAEERNKKELQAKRASASRATSCSTTGAKPAPTTVRAQSAASALGSRLNKPTTKSSNASTVATKVRNPAVASTTSQKKPMFDRGNPRFTAAKVASNSTIGYSKGRAVSSARRPLSDTYTQPGGGAPTKPVEKKSTLDHLLSLGSLEIEDEGADPASSDANAAFDLLVEDDDEPEVFQLDPVGDL